MHRQRKKFDFWDADSLVQTNSGFSMRQVHEIGQKSPIFFEHKTQLENLKIFTPGYIGIIGLLRMGVLG